MSSAPTFFISLCTRQEKPIANALIKYLKKKNIPNWCCLKDLSEGQEFRNEIISAVNTSKYFLILLTEDWVNSKECQYEYNMAERLNRKKGNPLIVPLVIDPEIEDKSPVAFAILANYQGIFIDQESKWMEGFNKVAQLAVSVSKQKEEAPTPKLVRQVSSLSKKQTDELAQLPQWNLSEQSADSHSSLSRQQNKIASPENSLKPDDCAMASSLVAGMSLSTKSTKPHAEQPEKELYSEDGQKLRQKEIEYETGDIYIGTINQKNERHGKGVLKLKSGSSYTGEFKNNKFNGNGKFNYKSGAVYEGSFKDDKFEGYGSYTQPNGNYYVGNFKNDKFNGLGENKTIDGKEYKGEFKDDRYEGEGTLTMPNGNSYEGLFQHDKFHGQGKYIYKNGSVYEGNFKEGFFHGQGKVSLSNGASYVGTFKKDMYNGKGTYTFIDKRVYSGHFKNDKFNGRGKLEYPNGNVYEGNFVDDKYHGYGVLKLINQKQTLSGNWVNGEWQG